MSNVTHEGTSEWERMQRADHDTLIRVETLMQTIATDIKEFKDGLRVTISDHDARIRLLEKLNEQFPPIPLVKELHDNTEWRKDFQTRYKTVVAMAGLTGGLIMFIITFIANFFGILKMGR